VSQKIGDGQPKVKAGVTESKRRGERGGHIEMGAGRLGKSEANT